MPPTSRVLSNASRRSHSTRGPKQSKCGQGTSRDTTRVVQESTRACSPFPSSLPHRPSGQDHEIAKWTRTKDTFGYDEASYDPGHVYMTHSDPSFFNGDLPSTTGVSWDNAMPTDHLTLDQCQAYITNQEYQVSGPSGSLCSRSQPMFDPLVIDPSMSLSNAQYPGSRELAVGIDGQPFQDDFAPGSLSYDSGSSIYMSPPVSPELQGQNWSGLSTNYSADAQYCVNGPMHSVYPYLNGVLQQSSAPPSPPMSDSDPHSALTSAQHPLVGSQFYIEDPVQGARTSTLKSVQGHHSHSGYATSGTSARIAGSLDQNPIRSSRPAHRILKPASEKPRGLDQGHQQTASAVASKPKEKPEAAQPRNHQLYRASPGRDGLFRCPFAKETQCAHTPTKQKCGYDKYLDSHLKPYQCKHADCRELKFSSNACLFRHEREAHGMHFYGKNPHRCCFAGCDRAIEGFPRRWNLYDHMRRVHKYDGSQALDSKLDHSDHEAPSKRKGSGPPMSCQMKRTSSSMEKARAASASYSRENDRILTSNSQTREARAQRMNHIESFVPVSQRTMNLANGFSSDVQHTPGGSAPGVRYGFSCRQ